MGGAWLPTSPPCGSVSCFSTSCLSLEKRISNRTNHASDRNGRRWTASGDGAVVVEVGNPDGDSRRYLIDLLDHEGRDGAHTIERHVGKTDASLIRRLETERLTSPFATLALAQAGTFYSLDAANRLIGSTLAQNRDVVGRVAKGEINGATIFKKFPYPTGHEYYRDRSEIRIFSSDPIRNRTTNGVFVAIRHDSSAPNGYIIHVSFPKNEVAETNE